MSVFILRRALESIFVIFVMTLLVFLAVNVIGNPVDIFANSECNQRCIAEIVRTLGLDRPLWEQYLIFVRNAFTGDLGKSFAHGLPTIQLIFQRMPATLELALAATLISIVIGLPLGMWAGLKPEALSSRLIMSGSTLGFSLPTFWIGIILILVFAVWLGWLPAVGRGQTVKVLGVEWSFITLNGLKHLALPAITLSLFKLALVIRLTRAGMREVLHADYIRFARAKGLSQRRILSTHVLKNILIPVVTVLGIELGGTIAFAVVTETIFSWPGMGKLLIDAIEVLDRPLIVAYLVVVVVVFVTINLLVDIVYSILDPRVRLGAAAK